MNIDKEREDFEAWAKSDGFDDLTRVGDTYDHPDLREAWTAWQARATLDEQKVCPSDSQIMFEWSQTKNTGDMRVDLVAFASALLSKYAAPAPKDEPDYWTYIVNGQHRALSPIDPPDDAYDEGTLEPLYAAPVDEQKRIKELEARIAALEATRIAYASEFPLNEDGDPDVENIHANIRALKAVNEQDARDAERYRYMRSIATDGHGKTVAAETTDARIDAAIAHQGKEA